MESVAGASDVPTGAAVVKSGNSNLAFSGDSLGGNNGQSGAVENDFFVDDLLDFSNATLSEDPEEQKQENMLEDGCTTTRTTVKSCVVLAPKQEFDSLPVSGLSVPVKF